MAKVVHGNKWLSGGFSGEGRLSKGGDSGKGSSYGQKWPCMWQTSWLLKEVERFGSRLVVDWSEGNKMLGMVGGWSSCRREKEQWRRQEEL